MSERVAQKLQSGAVLRASTLQLNVNFWSNCEVLTFRVFRAWEGTSDMESPTKVRRRHQRLFAWMFLLATISVFSLVGVEVVFPPPPLSPPPERSLLDLLEFDLPDPLLLALVVALVLDVASFAGLTVTTLLDLLEGRHQRSS
jgi:hypothetical protein